MMHKTIAPEIESVDSNDPLANFFRHTLRLNWSSLWFVALLYFGPFEKLILPTLGGFLQLNAGIRQWNPHVEAMLTGFVEFPVFLAYYLWSAESVVVLFRNMRERKSFTDLDAYDAFVQRALASFRKKRWITIGLIFGILTAVVMHFVVWSPNAQVPPWFGDRIWVRALGLFNIGLVAYTVSQSIIREILVILWLSRLWNELGKRLDVHPYHEDQAGGLGGIGQHTVIFLFFIVVLLLFILMATTIPAFLAQQTPDEGIRLRLWSPVIVGIWVSYLIAIPFMVVLLIFPAHTAMLQKRAETLSSYSVQLDDLLDEAVRYSAKDSSKKFSETLEQIEDLKKIRALILNDFPIWPLNRESKNMVGLTSTLPTLYSAVTFVVGMLS